MPSTRFPDSRWLWRPGDIGILHWGAVNHSRITAILHNPTYTGTYVYGRRRSLPVIEAGQIVKVKTQQLPQNEWKVMIHSSHPAYISWEEYLENAEQLRRNHVSRMSEGQLGIPREGSALLQGLVICGKCGRRMSPRYYGTGGKRASYECTQRRRQDGYKELGQSGQALYNTEIVESQEIKPIGLVHFVWVLRRGNEGVCWTVAAGAVDAAVATHVLESITLEQLDITLAVLNELEQQAAEIEHHWQLRLERVRYEADRASASI